MNMNRRTSLGAIIAMAGMSLTAVKAKAQFTEQQVRNGAQITSTGNVNLEQSASGSQTVEVLVDGDWVSEDGIYRDGTSQVIVNDGQVTSTGDVNVRQSASGTQDVSTTVIRHGGVKVGEPVSGECRPGDVVADPDTGQLFYVARDCCLYEVPCIPCKQKCQGDVCIQSGK